MKKRGIKCNICGDELFSMHRHDFRWCKCGLVAVDGGNDYFKITGNQENWTIIEKDSSLIKTKK